MIRRLYVLLLPLFLLLALGCIYLLPEHHEILPSAISEELPTGYHLPGWYGEKTQETDIERKVLSSDTKFSKAVYVNLEDPVLFSSRDEEGRERRAALPCMVSIVFSGNDMNNSIHRPERCLPAQGHTNLVSSRTELRMDDGHILPFTRLSTDTKTADGQTLRHIHYYVFISDSHATESHLRRTLLDMRDRLVYGKVQRWAYIQLSTHYGNVVQVEEKLADEQLKKLICSLLPGLIDWKRIHSPLQRERVEDERKNQDQSIEAEDIFQKALKGS